MSDNSGTARYLFHIDKIKTASTDTNVVEYATIIEINANKVVTDKTTLEQFKQQVLPIEETDITPEDIKVLNYIRTMLILSLQIERNK